jgi:2-polyprenyl-3-methyl-5-hydroxy-6-metoxy-1,4-benzoquinol methylase
MNNGTTVEVIRQFDKIAAHPDVWDHNRQYQEYLSKYLPGRCDAGLDIGCGTGELTKRLSACCKKTVGIDVSEQMIEEAKKRNSKENIEYVKIAAEEYLESLYERYDVIISIAALHHMDMENIFRLVKKSLKPNGIFLDLYKNKTIFEFFISLIAVMVNPVYSLAKKKRLSVVKEEKETWKDHYKYDFYSTIKEIKESASKILGKVKIRRHLFWRYSLIYKKSERGGVYRLTSFGSSVFGSQSVFIVHPK